MYPYNVRSTLGSFAIPKQRNKRFLGYLLKISTENPVNCNLLCEAQLKIINLSLLSDESTGSVDLFNTDY